MMGGLRAHGLVGVLLLAVGCGRVDLPGDGAIACSPAEDCPRGMRCADDGFCYRDPPPPGVDAQPDIDGAVELPDAGGGSLLLEVMFEGDAASSTGLEPVLEMSLDFADGHTGQGLVASAPARLEYADVALRSAAGTIELWLAPAWATDDGLNHHLVTWGYDHGLLLFRDANQRLRLIINRFGTADSPPLEKGVGYDFSSAVAGTWYHVAVTWQTGELALYVDGNRVARTTDTSVLAGQSANVAIGSEGNVGHAEAVLDDLRTWSVALPPDEIRARHAAGSAGR
jgi:hypothetical protein